jgi:hypothetical protein
MFKQVAVYCHCGKNLHVGVKKPRLAFSKSAINSRKKSSKRLQRAVFPHLPGIVAQLSTFLVEDSGPRYRIHQQFPFVLW